MAKKVIESKAVQKQEKKDQSLPDQSETGTSSAESVELRRVESRDSEGKWTSVVKSQLIPVLSLIVAILAIGVSAHYSNETLYQTFRTPFSPAFTAQPTIWLIKPEPTPNSFRINATVLTTIANEGALGGVIDNLVLVVSWPKGKWYLSPFNFVKTDIYYVTLFGEDNADPPHWLESPFSPIYVAGRSQVTKAIMFLPNTHDGLNFSLIEVGKHPVTLYARIKGKEFKSVASTVLDISQEDLNEWKGGKLRQKMAGITEESARALLGQQ